MTYRAVAGLTGRHLFTVDAPDTWALRRACRQRLGRRRSARMRYRQIGANSFLVCTPRGRVVMEVYKDAV